MSKQKALQKPASKQIEFETTAVYPLGKTTIVVESVFNPNGSNIAQILSRLMQADIESN